MYSKGMDEISFSKKIKPIKMNLLKTTELKKQHINQLRLIFKDSFGKLPSEVNTTAIRIAIRCRVQLMTSRQVSLESKPASKCCISTALPESFGLAAVARTLENTDTGR